MEKTEQFDEIPATIKPISTRQAAQVLGCSQRHVRKLIYDKRIRNWHISTRLSVVCERDVRKYAAEVAAKRKAGDRRGSTPKGYSPDRPPCRRGEEQAQEEGLVAASRREKTPVGVDDQPPELIDVSDLVSVPRAAELAGVTPATILNRITRGEIVATRFSGKAIVVSARSVCGHVVDRDQFLRVVDSLATVEQACRLLGVSEAYVPKLVSRGRLHGFKLNGKVWAIHRDSVEQSARQYDPTHHRGQRRQPGAAGRRNAKAPRATTAGNGVLHRWSNALIKRLLGLGC